MDHDVHGVKATVIDLGLSRMETGEADGLHFTVPDEEVFEGEGKINFSHNFDIAFLTITHPNSRRLPMGSLPNDEKPQRELVETPSSID